jgi:hypothetical protein
MTAEAFGTLPDGRTVDRHVLRCDRVEVALLTYGAVLRFGAEQPGAAA